MRERERSARKKRNQDRSTAVVGLWADDPYHAQGSHAAQAYNDNVGAEKPHRGEKTEPGSSRRSSLPQRRDRQLHR